MITILFTSILILSILCLRLVLKKAKLQAELYQEKISHSFTKNQLTLSKADTNYYKKLAFQRGKKKN